MVPKGSLLFFLYHLLQQVLRHHAVLMQSLYSHIAECTTLWAHCKVYLHENKALGNGMDTYVKSLLVAPILQH